MSVRRLDKVQPDNFKFSTENLRWAKAKIKEYPKGKQASAVIPVLWKAQEQEGWTTEPAIRTVAEMLGMSYIRVLEVATFYTMFHLSPVGKVAHIQVCGTTPCMLRGSDEVIKVCKKRIAETPHTLSADGNFSWEEVECLGACTNAPMVQVQKDVYEDLTAQSMNKILDDFEAGRTPHPGPQIERQFSAPQGGFTSLLDPSLYDGSAVKKKSAKKPAKKVAKKPAKKATKKKPAVKVTASAAKKPAPKAVAAADRHKPQALKKARKGGPDDLKMISGVGPKIEGILHELGIFHFDQVASWKKKEREWVDERLRFKGRIEREDWVKQAKALAKGGAEEYIRVFGKKPR